MSIEQSADHWAQALTEIEAEIAKLQGMADMIRDRMARSGQSPIVGGPGGGGGLRPDSFLKMSIPDATKKLLEIKRTKQSTQEIIDALVAGGLPPSKYNTVYSILSRRSTQVGDIINMKGDWALAEWYPNHRPKAKKDTEDKNGKKDEKEAATA